MRLRTPPVSPDGLPLLFGQLYRARTLNDATHLMIRVCCPACQGTHVHSWNPEWGLTGMGHRSPHCPLGSPYRPAGYWIGLDPKYDAESLRLLQRFTRGK